MEQVFLSPHSVFTKIKKKTIKSRRVPSIGSSVATTTTTRKPVSDSAPFRGNISFLKPQRKKKQNNIKKLLRIYQFRVKPVFLIFKHQILFLSLSSVFAALFFPFLPSHEETRAKKLRVYKVVDDFFFFPLLNVDTERKKLSDCT